MFLQSFSFSLIFLFSVLLNHCIFKPMLLPFSRLLLFGSLRNGYKFVSSVFRLLFKEHTFLFRFKEVTILQNKHQILQDKTFLQISLLFIFASFILEFFSRFCLFFVHIYFFDSFFFFIHIFFLLFSLLIFLFYFFTLDPHLFLFFRVLLFRIHFFSFFRVFLDLILFFIFYFTFFFFVFLKGKTKSQKRISSTFFATAFPLAL